jgi:hypothetical protein
MAVNKVKLSNGETLIDISVDTVTIETLADGVTAHDKTGAKITGTAKVGTTEIWIFEMEDGSTVTKAVYVG